ncbi:MAG: nucleotidyl transferase AbiEii/AbiGii toxin family protein [candidate division Zixibacteria bacterium]|nr:nucleotidyl transferase AbiEii/AbiGii toxin family protein [candidate division Zixibacteria bacterium]
MIDATEIRTLAARAKIDPGIIEKDYVLSKVLMALPQIDFFNEHLLFKGGTALKKFYYPEWRFSEDLDFTSKSKLKPNEVKSIFDETVIKVDTLFGLSMRIQEYSQYPRKGDDLISAQLKLGYDGPLRKSSGQKNNVRVDIAFEEKLVSDPNMKTIFSGYSDDVDSELAVYSLEEILSEKLRSILQRGKSRDYYDVWILLKEYSSDFSNEKLWGILKEKCKFKDIPTPKTEDFFDPERTKEASRYWERGLAHQLNELPNFEKVQKEIKSLINTVLDNI